MRKSENLFPYGNSNKSLSGLIICLFNIKSENLFLLVVETSFVYVNHACKIYEKWYKALF